MERRNTQYLKETGHCSIACARLIEICAAEVGDRLTGIIPFQTGTLMVFGVVTSWDEVENNYVKERGCYQRHPQYSTALLLFYSDIYQFIRFVYKIT